MDAKNTFKPNNEQQPYYIIMRAIMEAQRSHKQITIIIDDIKLTVDESSNLESTWLSFICLIVPRLNARSDKIWKQIEEHTAKK